MIKHLSTWNILAYFKPRNQLSTKLVLVSSINDKTSKEILTIKNDAVYNWQLPPLFTSPSQSRACWSKNVEHGNSEGLGSSESDLKKTRTIIAHPYLKILFFLLSLAISKFLFFSYIFCPENYGVWHFGTSTFEIVPDKLVRVHWYMCLKIENYCLKFFVKICMDKKVYENTWNVV